VSNNTFLLEAHFCAEIAFRWDTNAKRRYREEIYLEANAPARLIDFRPYGQRMDVSIYEFFAKSSCGLTDTCHHSNGAPALPDTSGQQHQHQLCLQGG
jgi:hypothetical protein